MTRSNIQRPARFALIGLINTAVDAAVFVVGLTILLLPLWAANILAWAVAVSGSYFLNGTWTFGRSMQSLLSLNFYFKFVAAGAIAGAISTIVLVFSAEWLPIWLAKAVAIGASFVVNYFIADRYVFPGEE